MASHLEQQPEIPVGSISRLSRASGEGSYSNETSLVSHTNSPSTNTLPLPTTCTLISILYGTRRSLNEEGPGFSY